MGMPMVNLLESNLECTKGEVIVNSDTGSYTPCFLWIRPQLEMMKKKREMERGGGERERESRLLNV